MKLQSLYINVPPRRIIQYNQYSIIYLYYIHMYNDCASHPFLLVSTIKATLYVALALQSANHRDLQVENLSIAQLHLASIVQKLGQQIDQRTCSVTGPFWVCNGTITSLSHIHNYLVLGFGQFAVCSFTSFCESHQQLQNFWAKRIGTTIPFIFVTKLCRM